MKAAAPRSSGATRGARPRRWAALVAVAAVLVALAATVDVGPPRSTAEASAPPARATGLADGPIGHVGRWLTDGQGRVVLLHGVNLVAKGTQSPAEEGFDDDDIAWLAANDFDVVRLGLVAADVMPTPGVIDTAYLDSFQTTVDKLTAAGILVLVDLHQDGWGPTLGDDGFPGWMTLTNGATDTHTTFPGYYVTNPAIQAAFDSLWTDQTGPGGVTLQDRVAAIYSALAARFAANPGVVGYDLLNEPWPGSTYSDCYSLAGGCPALDHGRLDPFYARMDDAIRGQGDAHLVFGEPWVLFNFGTAQTNIALPGDDPDSGMAFHSYPVAPAQEPAVLSNAETWSDSTGGALLESEFGATQVPTDIDRMVDENDGALIPWIWWSYDGELVPDLTTAPGGTNLNAPVADALIRPHPVLVAGTPTALDYDEATRTLTFSQSTAAPGGTHLAAGTATVVEVPDRPYPDGWHAVVTGGTVTSAPGASPLTVVADPGAAAMTITVSPGAPAPTSTTSTSVATVPSTTPSTPPTSPSTSLPTAAPLAVAPEPVGTEPAFTG
jgi:endoglycosylceramidase